MTYFPVISIIGAGELNCRVRNGNGCGLSAIIAGKKCGHPKGQIMERFLYESVGLTP